MMTFHNNNILLRKKKKRDPAKPTDTFSFPPFSFDLVPQNSGKRRVGKQICYNHYCQEPTEDLNSKKITFSSSLFPSHDLFIFFFHLQCFQHLPTPMILSQALTYSLLLSSSNQQRSDCKRSFFLRTLHASLV